MSSLSHQNCTCLLNSKWILWSRCCVHDEAWQPRHQNHLVLFMQVCFTFQSSHTMLPTRRPVNTTTSAAPGMPSTLTMPRVSAATASPGFTGTGSTVYPKVRGDGLIGAGGCSGSVPSTCFFQQPPWVLLMDIVSLLFESKC